jgi:dipeptidase
MVVALAPTTADGRTLFGHNCNRPGEETLSLVQVPGKGFEPGESVETTFVRLPQLRRTHSVLAGQVRGQWGYQHGVNDHNVAIGQTSILTRLAPEGSGLTGSDLVRLGLERASSAMQAADLLGDLITRLGHGLAAQVSRGDPEVSPAFLIADPTEAYVLASCGSHWALQDISSLRALGGVCHLHQDWSRLSHGLADLAISRGWWPADGSKLDFEATLCLPSPTSARALRRYGRAMLLLEQQRGHHKIATLRRLLCDHFDGCPDEVDPCGLRHPAPSLCCHGIGRGQPGTVASFLVQLAATPHGLPVAWYAFGTPCTSVYLPLFFEGELPSLYGAAEPGRPNLAEMLARLQRDASSDRLAWMQLRQALAGLQDRIDQETREFLEEAVVLKERGADSELRNLARSLMQHHAEQVEDLCGHLGEDAPREEEMAAFGF